MSKDQIGVVLDDLKILFKKDEILGKDFDNFLKRIKSDTVRNYLLSLKNHSQPEQALKDAFFSINSIFAKYLFKKLHPEVGGESGFVDYLIKDEREEIKLEIKPLFEAEFERGKSGELFKRIKKIKLNWEKHKDQIRKYLGRRGEFVVFTNLEEWYFFSRNFSLDENCYYFAKVNLFDLMKDFEQIGDFWQYLDRQEELSVKEPLDKKFFNSLKTWVEELGKVKFKVDEKKKTELIIKLINKFIFIQTLDNFWVIKGKYLEEKWVNIEREWQAKNKLRILRKFLSEINEYFYELYDTELFRDGENGKTILDYIERTDENIELFYNKLKLVLGIDYGTTAIGWERGIIQYNFRRIDEDILGKAYETFLAEVRKEQGIYYTPKYITQYIIENTVGKIYDELLEKIKNNLKEKNFDECKELIKKFISIKVLDPACGSGSFLIKALRLIWNKYNELLELLAKEERKYNNFKNGLTRSKEDEENSKKISELKNILNFRDKRDLISKIIIRHIHGNDLDANALEVAKVNLWLEAIKLAPSEFRYDRLPADTNHILPDLEMNLGNGDSLVGLPEDLTIKILKEKHENELKRVFELRKEYLDDPTKEEAIKEINEIKKKLRKELDEEFKKYLEENNLPLEILEKTKPFHWALDFWFVFFDENLEPKEKDKQGFDAVIGNPPYFSIREVARISPEFKIIYNYFKNSEEWKNKFRSATDIYYYFIMKSINLLSKSAQFGFIVENYWLENDYADKLRYILLTNTSIEKLINFGNIKIFEDAGNDTCILMFQKSQFDMNHKIKVIYCKKTMDGSSPYEQNYKLLNHIIKNIDKKYYDDNHILVFSVEQNTLSENKWVLSPKQDILRKIKERKYTKITYLDNLCYIGRGLQTGRNEIFRVNILKDLGQTIKVKNDTGVIAQVEKDLVKKYVKNSFISRHIISRYEHLIVIPPNIDINDFPLTKKYLQTFTKKDIDPKYSLLERHEYKIGACKWYEFSVYRNYELYKSKEKIISPYRASTNTFAYDDQKLYTVDDCVIIVPKPNEKQNILYILGILNSKLLTFWYKEAGKSKGGMLEFFTTPLKRMPIYKADQEEQKPIIQLVQKIIALKKLQHKFRELWRYYSRKFRNNYKSLGEILLDDKRAIQEGNFDKVWVSEASVYPDEQNELLEKEFKKFRIVEEGDNKLKIYGIEGQREELLLEITASKKEFRDIIYLELLELMDSRVKKKTLKDILSKSEISVIQPNIWEKSGNLLKITKEKFREWLEKENFEIKEEDIVKIDNEIQEIDNLIDARVFKLYGLTKEEVEIVLDSLNVVESVKNDILRKFEGLR